MADKLKLLALALLAAGGSAFTCCPAALVVRVGNRAYAGLGASIAVAAPCNGRQSGSPLFGFAADPITERSFPLGVMRLSGRGRKETQTMVDRWFAFVG